MKKKPDWIDPLILKVIERDNELCINCGKMAVDVHHIIPRSRGKRWSKKLWRVENMCCLCRECHAQAQSRAFRDELLKRLALRFGYDMAWTKEVR